MTEFARCHTHKHKKIICLLDFIVYIKNKDNFASMMANEMIFSVITLIGSGGNNYVN